MARVTLRALARSSSYAGAASLWQVVSRIFLIPLILAQIGIEGFGVWALLFSVTGSVSVVGTSFGLAYAKFTAEHDARDDHDRVSELIGSGLVLVGAVGLVGLSAVWLAREPLLALLAVPESLAPAAGRALLVVAAMAFVQMSAGCVYEILVGLQRADLRYRAKIAASVLYFVLAIALLRSGWGLVGLATAFAVGELIAMGMAWRWCRRLAPGLAISPFRATRRGMRENLSLGGRFQLLHALTQLATQGFAMLLSALAGPALLGVYEIARRLVRLAETGATAILAPMMPAFASLHSEGAAERAGSMHWHGSRVLFVAALASFGFLGTFAADGVALLTGDPYPLAAWTFQVLAVGFVVKQLSGMATASLRGRGTLGVELWSQGINVASRLAVLAPLWLWWGYRGYVASAVVGLVAGTVWFLASFARREGLALAPWLAEVALKPLLALGPVIVAVAVLAGYFDLDFAALSGRWALAAELAVWGAVFGALSIAVAWLGILSRDERAAVLRTALAGDPERHA